MTFHLRWSYMAQTRFLLTGLAAEREFVDEARRRLSPGYAAAYVSGSSASSASRTPGASTSTTAGPSARKPSDTAAGLKAGRDAKWFICPGCAKVNDHFSPTCPTQSGGVTPVPEGIRDATRAAIAAAPVSDSRKVELTRLCAAFWAKTNRKQR